MTFRVGMLRRCLTSPNIVGLIRQIVFCSQQWDVARHDEKPTDRNYDAPDACRLVRAAVALAGLVVRRGSKPRPLGYCGAKSSGQSSRRAGNCGDAGQAKPGLRFRFPNPPLFETPVIGACDKNLAASTCLLALSHWLGLAQSHFVPSDADQPITPSI